MFLVKTKKTFVLIVGLLTVLNSTLGTSLPANAAPLIGAKFGISDSEKLTLPITCYLIGYVVGPLLFAPLSELVGRRLVMISTFLGYFAFTLGCALAPTFNALCVFRFFSGVFASSPTAVIGGLYADIYANAVARGRAISGFMAVCSRTRMRSVKVDNTISGDDARPGSWPHRVRLCLYTLGVAVAILDCPDSSWRLSHSHFSFTG